MLNKILKKLIYRTILVRYINRPIMVKPLDKFVLALYVWKHHKYDFPRIWHYNPKNYSMFEVDSDMWKYINEELYRKYILQMFKSYI